MFYHDLKMQPLIYQDDLGRFAASVEAARDGTKKIESCMEGKLLDLHTDKSCLMLFGSKSQIKSAQEELEQNPIKLYGKALKEKLKEKYLGDIIHRDGNAASVEATVKDRYGRILVGTFEIRKVVEDCRSQKVGGIKAGLQLWETSYIPSLLNNCKTWVEISEETVNKLEGLQNLFYRILLNVPRTTPKASLSWELGGLKMKWRIIKEKLIFIKHILQLESSALAKQILEIQVQENLPGLSKECKEFIDLLNLPNIFELELTSQEWKSLVKKAVKKANANELKEQMLSYKKVKDRKITKDNYGLKPYIETLSLHQARLVFKHRASMSQFVKMNYKGSKAYKAEGWKCEECCKLDTEDHLLDCSGYKELRKNLDLENELELSEYLYKIYEKRKTNNTVTRI